MEYAIITYRNGKYKIAAKTFDWMLALKHARAVCGRIFEVPKEFNVGSEFPIESMKNYVEIDID